MTPTNTGRRQTHSSLQEREFFPCLKEASAPKGALGISIGLHGLLLFLVIIIPLLAPQTIRLRYNETVIIPPPPPRHVEVVPLKLPPIPKVVRREPELVAEKIPVAPPKPVLRPPEPPRVEPIPKPSAPAVAVKPTVFDPKPAPVAPPPPPPVVTNVFSATAPTSAAPTPARVAEPAGFGVLSANSVNRSAKPELAVAAGFGDAGGGSPQGGRPGRSQVVGTVGGFEGGVPGGTGSRPGGTGGNGHGTVAAAGFMASADAPKAPARTSVMTVADNEKPVEILSKPRPDYTDEARKNRLEGEVLLRVRFAASGDARVVEVIRGLGYGLNENAIRAAEQIRFKPALRGGQPVDSTAIVHIVFQLAY